MAGNRTHDQNSQVQPQDHRVADVFKFLIQTATAKTHSLFHIELSNIEVK